MRAHVKDGWHEIMEGISVYTENGFIIRATRGQSSAAVYKWYGKARCYVNALPVRYDTFRKGWKEDRYIVR